MSLSDHYIALKNMSSVDTDDTLAYAQALEDLNLETEDDIECLLEIDEALDSIIKLRELSEALMATEDPNIAAAILNYADPEKYLQENGYIPSIDSDTEMSAATEAIELKMSLKLSDMAKLWKMVKPFMGGFAKRFDQKRAMYNDQFEKGKSVFTKEIDEEKFKSAISGNLLDSSSYDSLTKTVQGIQKVIPKSLPIMKNQNEYNRTIKSFNFNKDILALAVRMGKFVSAGKSKMRNKQFYRKTTFEFDYRQNVTMAQVGYKPNMKALAKQWDDAQSAVMGTMDHIASCIRTYDKVIKPIGLRLANLPETEQNNRMAELQVKVLNDYLRVMGAILSRMDTVVGRFGSLLSAVRKASA